MTYVLLLALAALGQEKAAAAGPGLDPGPSALASYKDIEIDDLDREIRRQHDAATMKRAQIVTSQRLASRGLMSRDEAERENADLRSSEAREAELIAFRALKVYERDITAGAVPPDEPRAFGLLLDWVRKQTAIAQVDLDYQSYSLKQTKTLYGRKAVSRHEIEDAELASDAAEVTAALGRSREARVLWEMAAAEKPPDPREVRKRRSAYLHARVRHAQAASDGAKRRAEIARERARLGLIPPADLPAFERGATEAQASLDAERKALERHESEPPA